MHKLIIVCLSFLLASCATTQLSESDQKQIKSVAIVSLVPERAVIMKTGLLPLHHAELFMNMNDNVRFVIESAVSKQLTSSRPNWELKNIPYDPAALYSRLHGSGMVVSSGIARIEKDLAQLAAKNGVDALLVFTPSQYNQMSGRGVTVVFPSLSSYLGRGTAYGSVALHMINQHGATMGHAYSPSKLTYKDIDVSEYEIKVPLLDNMKTEAVNKFRTDITEVLNKNVQTRLTELGL